MLDQSLHWVIAQCFQQLGVQAEKSVFATRNCTSLSSEESSPLSLTKATLTLATTQARRHEDGIMSSLFLVSQADKWHLLHTPFLWFPDSFPFCSNISGITLWGLLLCDLPHKMKFFAQYQNTVRKITFKPKLMREGCRRKLWRELQNICEVISIPSLGGTKAQYPALP